MFTPRLDQQAALSIMRQHCMAMLARSSLMLSKHPCALILRDADEVLICNAPCRWYRFVVGMTSVGLNAIFTIFSPIV